jgi:uncharacterized protein (AIM24 family)
LHPHLVVNTRAAGSHVAPRIETFAHHLHRASELLRDRQPMVAREHLERAMAIVPNSPAARNLLAWSSLQVGRLDEAASVYESLEREFPTSVAAKVNQALVRLKLGQASLARQLLEQAVEIDPNHRRAWGYLGVALEQLGQIDAAEQALLAGHYAGAASGLRRRHRPNGEQSPHPIPEVTAEAARTAMPALTYRRRTLPPDPWAPSVSGGAKLAFHGLGRHSTTLRPPNFVPAAGIAPSEDERSGSSPPRPTAPPADAVDEIPFDTTIAPPPPSHGAPSTAPKANRSVIPLLDAALSSLLVVPHEASVVAHPTGLVLVGLVAGEAGSDGGFAARPQSVLATSGALSREQIPLGPHAGFVRIAGTGQLILQPPAGHRLLALQMDADVAFLREGVVGAFDSSLLYDLGRIRQPSGNAVSLVRFRGDGVIVLKLAHPFLAFDVRGEDAVTLRTDTLVGWIGLLAPEPTGLGGSGGDDFMTFSGEGTVLFRAPRDAAATGHESERTQPR